MEYIAPAIVEGLTGADIYCKACANIFREKVTVQGQGRDHVDTTLDVICQIDSFCSSSIDQDVLLKFAFLLIILRANYDKFM